MKLRNLFAIADDGCGIFGNKTEVSGWIGIELTSPQHAYNRNSDTPADVQLLQALPLY